MIWHDSQPRVTGKTWTEFRNVQEVCVQRERSQPHRIFMTHQGRLLTAYPEQIWTFQHPNPLGCPHQGSVLSGRPGPPLQHPTHTHPATLCLEWPISSFHIWLMPHSFTDFLRKFQIYAVNDLLFFPPQEGIFHETTSGSTKSCVTHRGIF